ncbi:MAG: polysaccharide deacetylase family protein [Candidatus Thorarchaeota archaeon]
MSQAFAWFKHLRMRRGSKVAAQFFYMWKLHRTPFKAIINNMLEILDKYNAKFTFPTVAFTGMHDKNLLLSLQHDGHEIASHGYKHIRYQFLPKNAQERDLKASLITFKQLGINIKGFRAPYNMYNNDTLMLIKKYRFLWDAGIGYNPKFNKQYSFFQIEVQNQKSSFVCIPLNIYTDDLLIDSWHLNEEQMGKIFQKTLTKVSKKGDLIMFDLHPIRIGQTNYIKSLQSLIECGTKLGGWFPTVSDAVTYWQKNGTWKHDSKFAVLLTGDIDNFVFFRDYISRIRN